MGRKSKKSKLIINIEYIFFLLFMESFRLLPLKVAFRISSFLAVVLYYLDSKHRKRTVKHVLFSGIVSSKKDAVKLAKKNYQHFGKIAVEIIKFDQYINLDNFKDHIKWTISDRAKAAFNDKTKGIIFVGAHYGNWEISGLGCSVLVRPILSVMRPFDNQKIGEYILSKRKMFGQEICNKSEALKPLLKALKNKKAVGILSDQHANTAEGVETLFFGQPARTHLSPALLQLKTDSTLVVGIARRLNDNFDYEFEIVGPFEVDETGNMDEDIKKLAQLYTTGIESVIRKSPEQWLWCHRRWLHNRRAHKK